MIIQQEIITPTGDPEDYMVRFVLPDRQDCYYSLEGVPPSEWGAVIALIRQEVWYKYTQGYPVDRPVHP